MDLRIDSGSAVRRAGQLAVWLALAACATCCRATTVVVLRTNHDIVVGADSKQGSYLSDSKTAPASASPVLLTIDNRIICIDTGATSVLNNTPYSFPAIVSQVKKLARPGISVSMSVQLLRAVLDETFRGFEYELRAGKVRAQDLAPPNNVLVMYYVAGFEMDLPFVYTVEMDVDWANKALIGPVIKPQPPRRNLSVTWTGGKQHGIIELRNALGPVSKSFGAQFPAELHALQSDMDLTAVQQRRLACGLLDLEVSSNPGAAKYPLTVISVPKSGLPKTVTYQRKCG